MSESTEHWPDFESWNGVPQNLRPGLVRYINQGVPVGSFMTAVLENNLQEAVTHADPESLAGLKGLVLWLYNQAPSRCHGSEEFVQAWQHKGGLAGGADK